MNAEERKALAGEVALGLLSDQDAARALAADPALASEVALWEHRLGALALDSAPVAPGPHVLAAINSAIAPQASAMPAARRTAAAGGGWFAAVLGNINLWRGLSAAGFAAAAALAIVLMRPPEPLAEQPRIAAPAPERTGADRVILVSSLLPRDGPPSYVATFDQSRNRLVIVAAATQGSRGGSPWLWLVPDDTGEPIGLGPLDPDGTVVIDLAAAAIPAANIRAGLVITLEPAALSSGALAQGPVIAHGKFTPY